MFELLTLRLSLRETERREVCMSWYMYVGVLPLFVLPSELLWQ